MTDEEILFQALLEKAERGEIEAQYELGWRSAIGIGLPQNEATAVQWLQKAATNGHSLAQNNLGARYLAGEGVPNDPAEAYFWFYKAAQNGDRKAGKNLDTASQRLTPEELQAVQERLAAS
jgi:TPR repeat protein